VLCCNVWVGTVVLITFGMDAVSTGNHMWPQRALVEIKLTVLSSRLAPLCTFFDQNIVRSFLSVRARYVPHQSHPLFHHRGFVCVCVYV
jgi:hypothetical protein